MSIGMESYHVVIFYLNAIDAVLASSFYWLQITFQLQDTFPLMIDLDPTVDRIVWILNLWFKTYITKNRWIYFVFYVYT